MNNQFEAWWQSLDVWPHDTELRVFPLGNGDSFAVAKIAMKQIWDSMSPFFEEKK